MLRYLEQTDRIRIDKKKSNLVHLLADWQVIAHHDCRVESGHDQNFSSDFLWSSSRPRCPLRDLFKQPLPQQSAPLFSQCTSKRLCIQIIHPSKTRQSAGKWELEKWRQTVLKEIGRAPFYVTPAAKTKTTHQSCMMLTESRTPLQIHSVCHLNNLCHCCFAARPYQQFTAAIWGLSRRSLVCYFKVWQTLCDSCVCTDSIYIE